jgi:hypothetical protein
MDEGLGYTIAILLFLLLKPISISFVVGHDTAFVEKKGRVV